MQLPDTSRMLEIVNVRVALDELMPAVLPDGLRVVLPAPAPGPSAPPPAAPAPAAAPPAAAPPAPAEGDPLADEDPVSGESVPMISTRCPTMSERSDLLVPASTLYDAPLVPDVPAAPDGEDEADELAELPEPELPVVALVSV